MVPGSHSWGDIDPYRDGTGGTRGIPSKGITGTLDDIFDLNRDGSFSPPPTAAIRELRAVPREVPTPYIISVQHSLSLVVSLLHTNILRSRYGAERFIFTMD